MKPVSIKFKCFGPYMDEQFIDFSELEKNGLFLICGETGAGKTTILDAMCYALYGKSSGGLRGDISVMRCKLAGKSDETLVEFVFDCGGRRYKFTRSLKYGRKNLNDSHNCMVLEEGEFVPIFENPKATYVNQKAQELIGLTYDQFRQVIILPQGQFEKLLVSDSAEKEKILVSLFHADRWQRIAEELYRRVAERDNALKLERQSIQLKLREYGCADLTGLETLTGETRLRRQEAQTAIAAAKDAYERSRQTHEAALLENQAFEELSRREKRVSGLLPHAGRFDVEERLLDRADRAEAIRGQYAAYQEVKNQKNRAQARLDQAQTAKARAEQTLRSAIENQSRHQQAQPENEERKRQITVLEESVGLYRSLEEKKLAAQRSQRLFADAKAVWEKTENAFRRADKAWQNAVLGQNGAMEAFRQAQQTYLRGIGGVLAQRLAQGQPCPVCGSMDHPAPAKPVGSHISDAELERYNQAMNQANDAANAAMKERSRREEERNRAGAAHNEAAQVAALTRRDYENAVARKIAGIDSLGQLEKTLAALKGQTAEFEQAGVELQRRRNDAQAGDTAAQAAVEDGQKELTAAQAAFAACAAQWQGALAAAGLENESQYLAASMEPSEKQRRRSALIQFRTDLSNAQRELAEQRALLDGRAAPDLAGLKERLEQSRHAHTEAVSRLALLEKRLEELERDRTELWQRDGKARRERNAVDADLEFAGRLRGSKGTGLQRYVLGVMLTSITVEANRLLKNVYAGRYQLFRTNQIAGSGHKGGLELEVYDSANNERRSVTTLSGGEKFLVALSLAIGLSTVVQAQGGGIRLEAMFIDEGFGSLDRESVNDALEVLQGIRRSAGLVGIISHVEQLEQTIPAKIEILKSDRGSRCRVRC